jgi:hypothetical protein
MYIVYERLRGQIGWRLAKGKVAVNAMMEGRGNTR